MQRTIFRYDRSKDRPIDLVLVVCSLLLGLISLRHFHSYYPDLGFKTWLFFITTTWLFGFALVWLLKIAGIGPVASKWRQVHLSLDEKGLTYARGGLMPPCRWPWTGLSDIECEGSGLLRRPSILFRPEAPGLIDGMTMEMTTSGRRMRLRDIFDASPREIVAKLNEYRDRALGGANAPAN